jgi:hypothetical protein
MIEDSGVRRVQRIGAGLSFILFPLMLLVGFLLHPNFFSLELVTDAEVWANEFRGNFPFHLGHLIVLFTVPLIIVVGVRCMRVTSGPGAWQVFIGGVAGIFGAFILAVDKGALTLVLTAFDTLPDAEFGRLYPALQVLLDRGGWLWLVQLLLFLPLGFAIQAVGLARSGTISKPQATAIVVGLLLLLAGDIEVITSVGAVLMCAGYIPMGFRELRGELEPISPN